jgi:hypothetical protein
MNENIRTIVENYTLNAYQVALISIIVSVITFFLTNYLKNYFENKLLKKKLETEHKFNQQKKIKEVLSKYKIHLLTSCEDFNRRMFNLYSNYSQEWINISDKTKDYSNPQDYYFHSFVYRFLSVLAWIKKIQKEIISIDTTLAAKNDLEFIKFLRTISQLLSDITTFIEGESAHNAPDHFFRNNLNLFPDAIITDDGIKSYSEYTDSLVNYQESLLELYRWFDSISPSEDRKRWDRLYFLHLIVMVFLNNYGYDFQKTDETKLKQVLENPLKEVNLEGFFELLRHYKLDKNKEIKKMTEIVNKE